MKRNEYLLYVDGLLSTNVFNKKRNFWRGFASRLSNVIHPHILNMILYKIKLNFAVIVSHVHLNRFTLIKKFMNLHT